MKRLYFFLFLTMLLGLLYTGSRTYASDYGEQVKSTLKSIIGKGIHFRQVRQTNTECKPVYRYRNITNNTYLYTINEEEMKALESYPDFVKEGIAWYSAENKNGCGTNATPEPSPTPEPTSTACGITDGVFSNTGMFEVSDCQIIAFTSYLPSTLYCTDGGTITMSSDARTLPMEVDFYNYPLIENNKSTLTVTLDTSDVSVENKISIRFYTDYATVSESIKFIFYSLSGVPSSHLPLKSVSNK
ncbi:secreted protein [Candidatus Magnetoovum chiemensis]|nr:secreted protein [Candidatus Magnetoovum chiemensis]